MPARNRPGAALNTKLTRKRCACGKQVKAKELMRYESCESCYMAAQAARAAAPAPQAGAQA